jgi:hypothetical protein
MSFQSVNASREARGSHCRLTSVLFSNSAGDRRDGAPLARPGSTGRGALSRLRPGAPEDLTLYCGLLSARDGTPVVALVGCYSASLERADEVLALVRGVWQGGRGQPFGVWP